MMSDFVSRFAQAAKQEGCGITVDAHKTSLEFDVVQYLWAAPLAALNNSSIDSVTQAVLKAAKTAGFTPEDVTPYATHLPNESAVLDACPFQPEMCGGQHLIISGSGKAS